MKCQELAGQLREDAPGVVTAYADPKSGTCYVFTGRPDMARLNGLHPQEDYADCWGGMLLCVGGAPPLARDGDHACHAGDFYQFGDVELLARVRPVTEGIHFGHWRGVGGPAQAP